MKIITTCAVLLGILSYSCKKEDKTPENPPLVVTPAQGVSGYLQTTYFSAIYNNTLSMDSSVSLALYESPMNLTVPNLIDAGTVTVNSQTLTYVQGAGYYNTGPKINLHSTLNFVISGSSTSTVVPFTYSFLPSMPVYNGFTTLPDSCNKSGFSITISGISNSNGGLVMLAQNSNSTIKPLVNGNGTATFSAQELANYTHTDPVSLLVSASNINKVKIGDLYYNIVQSAQFNKIIQLK